MVEREHLQSVALEDRCRWRARRRTGKRARSSTQGERHGGMVLQACRRSPGVSKPDRRRSAGAVDRSGGQDDVVGVDDLAVDQLDGTRPATVEHHARHGGIGAHARGWPGRARDRGRRRPRSPCVRRGASAEPAPHRRRREQRPVDAGRTRRRTAARSGSAPAPTPRRRRPSPTMRRSPDRRAAPPSR